MGNDVIHPNWIIDSLAAHRALPLVKAYYVHMTERTAESVTDSPPEAGPTPLAQHDMHVRPTRSASPRSSPSKKSKISDTRSLAKYSQHRENADDDSETEDEASTASDSDHPPGPGKVSIPVET